MPTLYNDNCRLSVCSTSGNGTLPGVPSKRHSISYGFASPSNYSLKTAVDEDCQSVASASDVQTAATEQSAIFYLAMADQRVVPINCYRPIGDQADHFVSDLSEKHRDKLRRFVDTEAPPNGESFVWIRDDGTMQTTILSVKTLQNHFSEQPVKRVKWRHLSMDRVSVYRYSLPNIGSKYGQSLRACCGDSNNSNGSSSSSSRGGQSRCLLIGIWIAIVVIICLAIVLSSIVCAGRDSTRMGDRFNVSAFSVIH